MKKCLIQSSVAVYKLLFSSQKWLNVWTFVGPAAIAAGLVALGQTDSSSNGL